MTQYSIQARDAEGEEISDEISPELQGGETILDHARFLARRVAEQWPDEQPWIGFVVEIHSSDNGEEWKTERVPLFDLLDPEFGG